MLYALIPYCQRAITLEVQMLQRRVQLFLTSCLVLVLALAACSQTPTPQPTAEGQAPAQPTTAPAAPATQATDAPAPAAQPTAEPAPAASTVSEEPYRIGIFSDVTTMNFWSYFGPNGSVWNSYVLTPQRISLYTVSDKNFDVIPALAEVPVERPLKQEGDKFVATIPLRQNVTWSDGTPVTANDVVFTAQTVLDLDLPGNWSATFDGRYLEAVEAVDDYTVKLIYNIDPGLAIHEWGSLQGFLMSKAYWEPVVEEAKAAVGALTPPADGAPEAEQTAYQEKLAEALNLLYNHEPEGEPLAGAFTMGNREQGAFIESPINPNYYQTGAQVQVFANGAYIETRSGENGYEIKVGDPVSQVIADYTVGPNTSAVVYTVYGSQDAAILALKNGDIDFILNSLGLQKGLEAQVTNQEGIGVARNPVNGYRYMGFNMRKQPMNNLAFRQAIATLIDKGFVCTQILQNACAPVDSFTSEANARWYSPEVAQWGIKEDGTSMTRGERVAKAVELLTAAGFSWESGAPPVYDEESQTVSDAGRLVLPDGTPMEELELLGPVPGYDPLRSTFAIWIEQWLNEVGIPVKANLKAFAVYRDQVVNQQDFDMYILGWTLGIFPNDLEVFFGSDYTGLGDFNSGGYSNPEFDAKAAEINTCTTVESCQQIAADLQKTLSNELPYVILFETGIIEAYRSDVLEYPYTDTLSGLQYINGLPATVRVAQ
jgi:peptide/nickel transport system substrate-binding protein